MRPKDGSGRKLTALPSRFLNLTNDFEFAGWGTLQNLSLEKDDIAEGEARLEELARSRVLGQFTASALAGNDVLGGVFYTLPAVVAVAGVYSPISLFIAPLVLFLWRPVMEALASALPISGAPYTYILNVSTKSFALVSAALLLLDFASTSIISAATAASYLAGEVTLPFPAFVVAILILILFTLIGLTGTRESARLALIVLIFHFATIVALMLAAIVHWSRIGNSQLAENWTQFQAPSPRSAVLQVFRGICLGVLGVTGFECAPSYVARITPGNFPKVLRNLHLPTIFLNFLVMLLVLAILPVQTVLGGANVLSVLAERSAGHWMRIWVVVDAVTVLCGGVLTGLLSACELFEQLSRDRVIPAWFLKTIPRTGSPYMSVFVFMLFSGLLYATAGASLSIVSQMFSLVWLTVMILFPISLLLLKYNRGRLQGPKPIPIGIIFAALCIGACVFIGNIVIAPSTAGYFAAYVVGIVSLFALAQHKIHLIHWVYWLYDQFPSLHESRFSKSWGTKLINHTTKMKKQPVCILVKSDEIHHLFRMVLYVQNNEETSCLKIIHFNDTEGGVPSELEANAKILDEAFPEITIDLVIVRDTFEPTKVAALAHRLKIPTSLMFMGCPGRGSPYSIADFGTRIIAL
ncbi:hypothetical protein BDN72DRAFT_757165 [Pluteus cervinus]|uniref:Uncharacterized protein n=1 Tax=Pluteus cervinus TaxID=181527 RepID=A0ACD3BD73_9AGAR|nr:hypothetical protein BDN72DRAFT_757165 [Pluteus cervinus]